MSGHSKWKTIKHAKAATDAKRGKVFSLIGKEITIAVKAGGGNAEFNPQLRTLLAKAKAANMPNENIQRAIKKGTGEIAGEQIEELIYEGYAYGVGFIVEVTTDNKNRTVSDVRSAFEKCGGNLANSGALAFTFQRKGQFFFTKDQIEEEKLTELALEADAEDILTEEDGYEVLCAVADFDKVAKVFEDAKVTPESAELVYLPMTTVTIEDAEVGKKLNKLTERLEDLEDVTTVYSNYELSPALHLEEE